MPSIIDPTFSSAAAVLETVGFETAVFEILAAVVVDPSAEAAELIFDLNP